MSGIFVEYSLQPGDPGYTDKPMRRYVSRRGYLDFLPREEYDGRRVEEFATEEEAIRFIGGQVKLYTVAHDLISAEEQILIRDFLVKEIKPLADRVAALEEQLAKPKPRRRSKATEDKPAEE